MSEDSAEALSTALLRLLEPSPLDDFVGCCSSFDDGDISLRPKVALMFTRFKEDIPNIPALGNYLCKQAVKYAIPRKKRNKLHDEIRAAAQGDLSDVPDIMRVVRDSFIEFRTKYPSRASEVGEVLAYCLAVNVLGAPQMAAKMALKTSSNMPVYGLDGIHALFAGNVMTIYFLESKLTKTAASGIRDFASSVSGFASNQKQYLLEYQLVGDLGNLDALEGSAREQALDYFDILKQPLLPRRERTVGVICYSEKHHFSNKIPVDDSGPIDAHELHFSQNYRGALDGHRKLLNTHLSNNSVNVDKCQVFFVAVPDVNELRSAFYLALGIPAAAADADDAEGQEDE